MASATYSPPDSSSSTSSSSTSSFDCFWKDSSARNAREHVLSHLDTSSLLSLRLATRQCAKPAAPHAFKDLTITFKSTTFTKPARLAALTRIGHHVRRLTFEMPHGDETFLPPLLEPTTGSEVEYVYTPNCSPVRSKPSRTQLNSKGMVQPCELNEGAKELSDLLVKQYPPLYHAAVNVPSFVKAFAALSNLRYLTVSCPAENERKSLSKLSSEFGFAASSTAGKSIVEHALVSLRIAIERNSLPKLDHLTLSPVQAHTIQYLNPVLGLGARPNSIRRWRQIKHLNIQMPVTTSAAHLKILHAYIGVFAPSLKTFTFHWLPGPARPSSAGAGTTRQRESKMPIRPSSTGTSYFPRVITPQASNLSDGGNINTAAQRGANPLTLHMSAFLQPTGEEIKPWKHASKPSRANAAPKEKTSSASLDNMQSMTSASTLDSDSSTTSTSSTPHSSPTRRPRLRCQPPTLHHQSSATSPTSLRPLHLPHLTHFELHSILTTSTEISSFISTHGPHLSEFKFEATTLTYGDWDAALAPLTALAGGCDAWKREARREEEVPICLGPELSPVESSPVRGCGIGDVAVEGGLDLGGGGRKEEPALPGNWAAKSPLLSMAMGMGVGVGRQQKDRERQRMRVIPGGCAAEAAMGMNATVNSGMGWDRRVRKGTKLMGMGSGQKALEDGVRKLLAQTVFPWF